jgi:hypothetical protein
MHEEMEVLHRDKICELTTNGWKSIANKWAHKIERDDNDQVKRYRERRYILTSMIYFSRLLDLITTISVALEMCPPFDLHIEPLDIRTAFLYGELE